MRFLVVDDDKSILRLIKETIIDNGDSVTTFYDSVMALDYLKNNPANSTDNLVFDIAILDVMMPDIDGLEIAKCIRRELNKKNHTPIIFLTSSDNENILKKCLTVGDDFILKNISSSLLQTKLNAIKRNFYIYRDVNNDKIALEKNNDSLQEEHFLTKEIFDYFTRKNDLSSGNIQHESSPVSTFNGDIFLSTRSPMNTLYLFLGDVTGHGLPAAIATIPIHKIFNSMAQKGLAIREIAHELNKTLYDLLPDNIFCSAIILEMSTQGKEIRLWSGGMPAIICTTSQGEYIQSIPSSHMALGSLPDAEFESQIQSLSLPENSHCYLFSDGISETCNGQDQLFGEDGIKHALEEAGLRDATLQHSGIDSPANTLFRSVLEDAQQFSGKAKQHDDCSLVELIARPLQWQQNLETLTTQKTQQEIKASMPWHFSMQISGKDFQRGDPISQIIQLFNQAEGIKNHQDGLSTILSELYSNAFEHGILKLDSDMKQTETGFMDYYLKRSQQLDTQDLSEHSISINLRFHRDENQPQLEIEVTDSGCGFDYLAGSQQPKASPEKIQSFGHGQHLITNLCNEFQYSNSGRTARARYYL